MEGECHPSTVLPKLQVLQFGGICSKRCQHVDLITRSNKRQNCVASSTIKRLRSLSSR